MKASRIRPSRLLLATWCLCAVTACAGTEVEPPEGSSSSTAMMDQGEDARDMSSPTEDMPSGEEDMGAPPEEDMGEPPEEDMRMSEEDMGAPGDYPRAAEVVSSGAADRILLRGAVLAPQGVLDPGEVLVVGDQIACAAEDCSADPDASGATVIETHGIISPGLIDAHNHVAYNFLPEWIPPAGTTYTNRYQWADEPSYEEHVLPYTAHRSSNSHFCPAARWGELRSLLHGTTMMQGQSFERRCTEGGVRNADHDHLLQYDHMRTTIASPRDITDDQAMNYVASFQDPDEPVTRLAVHMGEGYADDNITEEFSSFAGRDPRNNRHAGVSLIEGGVAILIHAVALTDAELEEVAASGSSIVWSPSSNFALYERTADIDRILELGIPVGIGPDWTISGEDDMLAEMSFAHQWASAGNSSRVTPEVLWRMATREGARVVGLDAFVGELAPGYVADVTVFRRRAAPADLYEQVVEARAEDVRLVLIGGQAHAGDRALEAALETPGGCDAIDACGVAKFACMGYDDTPMGIDALEGLLVDILEGNGYPADEQYGRGDELLPLIDCSR